MNKNSLSENNLISSVKSSLKLDFLSSAQVWFTHINLVAFPENIIPENGLIAEQLISLYDLEEFEYYLMLVE